MKLTIRERGSTASIPWYVIECEEREPRSSFQDGAMGDLLWETSARFSDADVEGPEEEMLAIAKAIRERGLATFRRCEVEIVGDMAYFRSPRNSETSGEATLAEADDLAAKIEALLGKKTHPGT
jgi:hypothetical protein